MAQTTLSRFKDVHAALCNPKLRQSLYDAGEVIMKDVLLTLHGEEHKIRRHLELRLFRRNYAHHYETNVFPKTLAWVLDPLVTRGETDLVDFGYRVTMNLTADFAGVDRPQKTSEETDRLLAIVKTFSEGATLVHSDRNPSEVIAEVKTAQTAFRQFLEPSWSRRQRLISQFLNGELKEDELPRDVLTVLLRNQDSIELADELIEREISFYLQAGSHSTANSMVHAVNEIFSWADEPTALLEDPLLLQKCVHESMRLHPASPVAWRTPTEPITIASRDITPDDLLILDLHAANRDPDIFGDDPEKFDPYRDVTYVKTELYGLTFGAGVHMCTGRDLDGGVASRPGTDKNTHQYGIVCMLIKTLLEHKMIPHKSRKPTLDLNTLRNSWGTYPVQFEQA